MKIAILVEGKTEKAFKPFLQKFLKSRLQQMPKIDFKPQEGRIPKEGKLQRIVRYLLDDNGYDAVIALTDIYTGSDDFTDGKDAKEKMKNWVGNEPRFYPHVAQYDFEAWLLPFWSTIQRLAGHDKSAPSGLPEQVNHNNPPSQRIAEIFRLGKKGRKYSKPNVAASILKENNLMDTVNVCPELKAFLNTILELSGGELIP